MGHLSAEGRREQRIGTAALRLLDDARVDVGDIPPFLQEPGKARFLDELDCFIVAFIVRLTHRLARSEHGPRFSAVDGGARVSVGTLARRQLRQSRLAR